MAPMDGSKASSTKVGATTQIEATLTAQTATVSERLTGWLESLGVADWQSTMLASLILLGALLVGAALLFFVVRPLILRCVKAIVERTAFGWDNRIRGHGVFNWLSQFASALLILLVAPGLLSGTPALASCIVTLARVYLILAGLMLVFALANFCSSAYLESQAAKRYPIGTFVQVFKLVALLFALILVGSAILGRSPVVLIGGLGVFAGVLMLIFKDVLLGFVAGIQIVSDRMVAIGDWLEMPGRQADGDVIFVGLTTVKVRNFDKTITTIPTHALISESFKNWRGMSESGGRRIKRSIAIDVGSVRFVDQQLLERISKVDYLKDYLKAKQSEIESWNLDAGADTNSCVLNGRRQTNIGIFRAYMLEYLRRHPKIHQEGMTLLVRQLEPTSLGLPIQLYCFTKTTAWIEYENIQADIFDHLLAAASEFELQLFQEPSGRDVHPSPSSATAPAAKKAAPRKRATATKKPR